MKNIVLLFITLLLTSSCASYKLVPNYVTSKELANVTIGSTKEEVRAVLGKTLPFDILAGWSNDCEVHQYKYKKPCKTLPARDADLENGLTSGIQQYEEESDVYLVYKNGKLTSLITDAGKKELVALLDDIRNVKDACNEKGIAGCMDPASLNYNKDAVISDGSCKYAPCGYKLNPDYNPKRPVSECNLEFIPIKTPTVTTNTEKKECTSCDILEKLVSNGNAKITINLGSNQSSGGRLALPSKKKTTLAISEEGDKASKMASERDQKKAEAKAKAEQARAAAKAKIAERKAKRTKPLLFQ